MSSQLRKPSRWLGVGEGGPVLFRLPPSAVSALSSALVAVSHHKNRWFHVFLNEPLQRRTWHQQPVKVILVKNFLKIKVSHWSLSPTW